MTTRKVISKAITPNTLDYIGEEGEIFYDPTSNSLRISDGSTSGGVAIGDGVGNVSSYTLPESTLTTLGGVKGIVGNSVVLGNNAASSNQGNVSIAIGLNAGQNDQGNNAIAIGGADSVGLIGGTAFSNQGNGAIAIGSSAGANNQGDYAIAIGSGSVTGGILGAGGGSQGTGSIAIGTGAGAWGLGDYSIDIGYMSGKIDIMANRPDNTITLNATGAEFGATSANTFNVKPVREVTGGTAPAGFYPAYYNPTTGEFIVVTP